MIAMLFKKKEDLKPISESLRNELIQDIYKLGYEVGHHHHSEIGWVSDTYNNLIETASEYDIEDLLKEYYTQGKTDGEERRKDDIDGISFTQGDIESLGEIPVPRARMLPPTHRMVARPAATDIPQSIERPKMVERPKALDGFIPVSLA